MRLTIKGDLQSRAANNRVNTITWLDFTYLYHIKRFQYKPILYAVAYLPASLM